MKAAFLRAGRQLISNYQGKNDHEEVVKTKPRADHVLIPTRGHGRCPKEQGPDRFEEHQCNTQARAGDEICIAVQDLIIATDGSRSVRAFNTLLNYAIDLLSKYGSQYIGSAAMRVALVEFGNCINMEDGVTVSPAMNVHTISSDFQ